MHFLLPTFKKLSGVALTLVFLISSAQAFQVVDGGSLRVMQTGNPGTSSSFTVVSKLRIEGNGVVVPENDGAVDWEAVAEAEAAAAAAEAARLAALKNVGSGATVNHIVRVCDLETGKCNNVFPAGNDADYTAYESCLSGSASTPYGCAEQWVVAKGYLPEDQFLALQEAAETEVVVEDSVPEKIETAIVEVTEETEEEFLTSAEKPVIEKIAEVITPPVAAEDLAPKAQTAPVVINTPTPRVTVPLTPVAKTKFRLDLYGNKDLSFPRFEGHASAPINIGKKVSKDHCLNLTLVVGGQGDLWKWLAYRLLFILTGLTIILFLLAIWVFVIWKRYEEK